MLTKEDLEQIAVVVRTEVQTVRDELRGEIQTVRDELRGEIQTVRDELRAEMQAMESRMLTRMNAIRDELLEEMRESETRLLRELEALSRRTERLEASVHNLQMQLTGMSRSLTQAEQLDSQLVHIQNGQQRAIDQIVAELTAIKSRIQALEDKTRH